MSDWIPVTERMPEEYNNYRCNGDWTIPWASTTRSDKASETLLITFEDSLGLRQVRQAHTQDGEWVFDYQMAFRDCKVIAWMPFPEPYKNDNKNESEDKESL